MIKVFGACLAAYNEERNDSPKKFQRIFLTLNQESEIKIKNHFEKLGFRSPLFNGRLSVSVFRKKKILINEWQEYELKIVPWYDKDKNKRLKLTF